MQTGDVMCSIDRLCQVVLKKGTKYEERRYGKCGHVLGCIGRPGLKIFGEMLRKGMRCIGGWKQCEEGLECRGWKWMSRYKYVK